MAAEQYDDVGPAFLIKQFDAAPADRHRECDASRAVQPIAQVAPLPDAALLSA
jgi:hypothetical protein